MPQRRVRVASPDGEPSSDSDFGSMGEWTDIPSEALDVAYYKTALEGPKNADDFHKLFHYGAEEWKEFVHMLMEVHGIDDGYW